MTADLIAPGSDQFQGLFTSFRRSAFRLETLQAYAASGEDPAFDAFLAGRGYVRHPGKVRWLGVIGAAIRAGRTMSRVHVVREPLTDYMRFELTWAYAPNVAAGEEIGIIPVPAGGTWPRDVLEGYDFWLLDDTDLYEMVYDEVGTFIGVRFVDEQYRIAEARRLRDAAVEQSVRWAEYVDARPGLAAHIPAAS